MAFSFVAYSYQPPEIGRTIRDAITIFDEELPGHEIHGWEENDIAGRFISEPILSEINECKLLTADITRLNFNVTYEIGYAIGKGRRVLLVKNSALTSDDSLVREIGIFDTLGYSQYAIARDLVKLIQGTTDLNPISTSDYEISPKSPIYIVLPKAKTDLETQLISRVKKAFRLPYRSFDPEEQGRMAAIEAIKNVAMSHGVVVPLLSSVKKDFAIHNQRAAFVAGLAHGLEKEVLLLQSGDDPVPMDYRDLVRPFHDDKSLEKAFSDFAPAVYSRFSTEPIPVSRRSGSLLHQLNLGASSAENEMVQLPTYYLETEEYRRVNRGESQIVAGRKGSGKTALFVRLRNSLRRNRQNVVLDLRPEGFQLLKFKDVVLKYFEQGTKEHTVTAFWEYLILLEICHKLLEKDKEAHITNHTLYEPYQKLAHHYAGDDYVSEGDFAERMLKLMQIITSHFQKAFANGNSKAYLSAEELTNLLYLHNTKVLRDEISNYLSFKPELWILFDNLDKGWPATGLGEDDVLLLRCLIDALSKLDRHFRRHNIIESHGVVFLRNDVYEIMINYTPDRGKSSRVILDWTDADLLRELLRLRFISNSIDTDISFENVWQQICVSHVGGEESSSYLIDRCLMRPRSLIDFIQYCRSHALNLGHKTIEEVDILKAEESFSSELVANIGFEIRDVFPSAGDVLYEFIGSRKRVSHDKVMEAFTKAGIPANDHSQMLELLLWYGFLGIVRDTGKVSYIYDVNYDRKRLLTLMNRREGQPIFFVNPAFWAGLEIDD